LLREAGLAGANELMGDAPRHATTLEGNGEPLQSLVQTALEHIFDHIFIYLIVAYDISPYSNAGFAEDVGNYALIRPQQNVHF
jgi:hypothetical protein